MDGSDGFISKPERLQKILSSYGVASRREAERMILDGRVQVNGIPAKTGQSALTGIDEITVDGIPLDIKEEHVYIMLNKPCGYITTRSDEHGRKTVMELITGVNSRVYPVGRLDKDSEGLLLFTNDGEFANAVMHPSRNKQKTYEVKICGDTGKTIQILKQPVDIGKYTVHASDVGLIEKTTDGGVVRLTVVEGRNRQVRKMCAACGVKVISLKRVSIGSLKLGSLETGKWRFLTDYEVKTLG